MFFDYKSRLVLSINSPTKSLASFANYFSAKGFYFSIAFRIDARLKSRDVEEYAI